MVARENLRKLSLILSWGATLGAFAFPAILLLNLLHPGPFGPIDMRLDIAALKASVPAVYRYGSLVLSLVPDVFTFWAWWSLRRLMQLYAEGKVFTEAALHQLHNIALALLGSVIAGIVFGGLSGFVLGLPDAAHRISISFGLGSDELSELFKAAVVYVIALVMSDARRIADENAKFV